MFECLLCKFKCETRRRIRKHITEIHDHGVAGVQARNKVTISAKRGKPMSMYYVRGEKGK